MATSNDLLIKQCSVIEFLAAEGCSDANIRRRQWTWKNPSDGIETRNGSETPPKHQCIGGVVHIKYEILNNISGVEELWSEMKKSLHEVIEKNVSKTDLKKKRKERAQEMDKQ
ncbi:hypothetical protein PoB_007660600 [Plakobranchus ocellatus]|uniref:Uncharacterized protein n=1 Tax=Plakobranchus ocellatus TaxID=259542 RepID=A0AAV4E1Y3_9GAST|nr:hypothetical protein PoB_007660600 [Plakobranchus ocellatus]